MEELIEKVASPYFWIILLPATYLMSLLASYTKPWLDKKLASVSERRRMASEKAQLEFEESVEALVASDELGLISYKLNIISNELWVLGELFILYVLFSLIFLIKPAGIGETLLVTFHIIVIFLMSIPIWLLSYNLGHRLRERRTMSATLREARKRIRLQKGRDSVTSKTETEASQTPGERED